MPGLGRKVFTAGDVLTASDVQNYMMDQTVMNFAGTAARSSAIATPTDGMVSVLSDIDELQYYNGTAWQTGLPFGAWQTWAPTLSSGWANGNGVWTAKYCQIGKTVIAVGYFVVGSTTTRGTGLVVSLPVTASNLNTINGTGWVGVTATTVLSVVHVAPNTTSQIALFAQNTAGTFISSGSITTTAPITWATGSVISFTVVYEAA